MPRPLPKRRRGGPPRGNNGAAGDEGEPDHCHNRDHPCCQELANICQQVLQQPLQQETSSSSSSLPTLPELIRHYLANTVSSMVPAPPDNNNENGTAATTGPSPTGAAKKKRKKKKKKKLTNDDGSAAEDDEVVPCFESSPSLVTDDDLQSAVPPASTVTQPPSSNPRGATTSLPDYLSSPGTPSLFDLMVRDYFASTQSNVVHPVSDRDANSFWNRVAAAAADTSCSEPEKKNGNPTTGTNGGGTSTCTIPSPDKKNYILPETVRPWVSRIVCRKCREHVSNYLETKHKILLREVSSSVSSNELWSEQDYIQMEEGDLDERTIWRLQHPQRELAFHLTISDDVDDDEDMVWQLRGMGLGETVSRTHGDSDDDGNTDKAMGRNGSDLPLDWRNVILYKYLLARGVVSTELDVNSTDSTNMDPVAIRGMADSVLSTMLGHDDVLKDCASILERQAETLHRHKVNHDRGNEGTSNIDMTSFPIFKRVDEESCLVMDRLLGLLMTLTSSLFMAHSASTGSAPSWRRLEHEQLQGFVLSLWESWLQTSYDVISEIQQFEHFMQQLTDRHGVFPQHFFSSTYRDLYLQLVQAKLSSICRLLAKIRDLLDSPTEAPGLNPEDHRASMHRKLLTYGAFCQMHLGLDYKRLPPVSRLDEAMQSVLEAVRECIETLFQATWPQVQNEHQKREQRLLRRCQRALSEIKLEAVSESQVREYLEFVSVTETIQDSSDGEVETFSHTYRNHIKVSMSKLVVDWIREQCFRHKSNSSAVISPVPTSLLFTMVHSMEDFDCFKNTKSRAACVLVVLFYRWLLEIWTAWRAERAELELLRSMAVSEADSLTAHGTVKSPPVTGNKTKSSKKKKKKKSDTTDAEPDVTTRKVEETHTIQTKAEERSTLLSRSKSPRAVAMRAGQSESSDDVRRDEKDRVSRNTMAEHQNGTNVPIVEETLARANGDTGSVDAIHLPPPKASNEINGNLVGAAKNHTCHEQLDAGSATGEQIAAEMADYIDDLLVIDTCLQIGLSDSDGFQSAEDFLVGRLLAVLKAEHCAGV